MDSDLRTSVADLGSGVSWAAVAGGAVGTAALALLLVAFGAGIGFSAISPWSNSGVSASGFEIGTGIYLVIISVMSSAIGGYLAGRLRTKDVGYHSNEVFFRDTAHGFLAWAFATLISATALTSTTAYLANGAMQTIGAANPTQVYVDKLFRSATPAPAAAPASENTSAGNTAAGSTAQATGFDQQRAEISRLWAADFSKEKNLTSADRSYVAQVVAARTGLSQADAEKRVDDVTTQAKAAADETRRGAAHLSFWLTAAMLFGAFAASLAAAEGGALRDGTWNGRVLTPRTI